MHTTTDVIICDEIIEIEHAAPVVSDDGLTIAMACACGCTREIKVDSWLIDSRASNRVRLEYRPSEYCKEYDGFVISGSAGYFYFSRRCLNSINES